MRRLVAQNRLCFLPDPFVLFLIVSFGWPFVCLKRVLAVLYLSVSPFPLLKPVELEKLKYFSRNHVRNLYTVLQINVGARAGHSPSKFSLMFFFFSDIFSHWCFEFLAFISRIWFDKDLFSEYCVNTCRYPQMKAMERFSRAALLGMLCNMVYLGVLESKKVIKVTCF